MSPAARKTWKLWFSSWWAAWWVPEDVPQLEVALRLWDTTRSKPESVTKFLPIAHELGLTPKGRFDLRWMPPATEDDPADSSTGAAWVAPVTRRQRVVDEPLGRVL